MDISRSSMLKNLSVSLFLFALISCAGPGSTKTVTNLGPDTYHVRGWHTEDALKEATEYCNKKGKNILVTNLSESSSKDWASIIFRCLSSDDPEYKRPDYQKPPTAVIEDRRK